MEVNKEVHLEMRREIHNRVSEEYRRNRCDEKGRLERNLSKEEMGGIEKLEKRKAEKENWWS